jgi:hypothetical protein
MNRDSTPAGTMREVLLLMIRLMPTRNAESEPPTIEMVEGDGWPLGTAIFAETLVLLLLRLGLRIRLRVRLGITCNRRHRGGRRDWRTLDSRLLFIHLNPARTRRTHRTQNAMHPLLFEGGLAAQNTHHIHHGDEPARVRLRENERQRGTIRHP